MKYSESPAVDALENDFDSFFEYLTAQGEVPQIGGMGVVTPMERSAADVEIHANTVDYRGRFLSQLAASASRHDKQDNGVELMQ
ncbi:MAG: hypothetical protein KGN32_08785 [Burkholderiales bacterium]|nr:hypothetical protein [Burkholderiales bacterium]